MHNFGWCANALEDHKCWNLNTEKWHNLIPITHTEFQRIKEFQKVRSIKVIWGGWGAKVPLLRRPCNIMTRQVSKLLRLNVNSLYTITSFAK